MVKIDGEDKRLESAQSDVCKVDIYQNPDVSSADL